MMLRCPRIQVKVIDGSWTLDNRLTVDRAVGNFPLLMSEARGCISIFVVKGQAYEDELEAGGLPDMTRNWHIYPKLKSEDMRRFQRHLEVDEFADVKSWAQDGVWCRNVSRRLKASATAVAVRCSHGLTEYYVVRLVIATGVDPEVLEPILLCNTTAFEKLRVLSLLPSFSIIQHVLIWDLDSEGMRESRKMASVSSKSSYSKL
jgi:hypothetical protein